MAIVIPTDSASRVSHVPDRLARGESITITQDGAVLGTITPAQPSVTVREALEGIEKVPRAIGIRYRADIRNGV